MNTYSDNSIRWFAALSVAAIQNGNAFYAAYASSLDRLTSGPCYAGVIGAQVSFAILGVVLIWSIILALKSRKTAKWHEGLKPLGFVAFSSVVAILIGADTGARYCSA